MKPPPRLLPTPCALIFTLTLTLALLPASPTLTAAGPPNILLILVDDLGYGDLSSHGAPDLKSPNIDRLFSSGMRFDQFYANCPVCSPTRAALLTGRYPDLVGVPGVIRTHPDDNWGFLTPNAILLPQLLGPARYHSALVGKWHLGLESPNTPNERGFDLFHGFLGDMMDDYYHHRRHDRNYMRHNTTILNPSGHATDLFTGWAIDYLNSRRNQPAPFLLCLSYNAPHTPIQPPTDWLEKVQAREPGIPLPRARLVALIEHLDHGIGQVIDTLKANGQDQSTLVLFTSDNGGQLSAGARCGPYRGGKQDLYEGGIRVPFCAVWPGRIKPGSLSARISLTMDLYPTLAEAAETQVPHPIEGVSLLPTLLGHNVPNPDRDLFWVRREGNARYNAQDHYAIRRGDWKLLHNLPFQPYELYNLKEDPAETTNVRQQNQPLFNELSSALRKQIQRAGSVPWQPPIQ